MKSHFLVFTYLCLAISAKAQITGYEAFTNWSDLPKAKTGIAAGLASSYDRQGGNNDYNYYLEPDGWQTTDVNTIIAELPGPGIITRFWMPHATANASFPVKITIDGNVVINTNSNILLDGAYSYIGSPFVYTRVGGQVSYEPIAFRNSLKIESMNYAAPTNWAKSHYYYQYNYAALSCAAQVAPYCGTLTPEQQAARNIAASIISSAGSNPAGYSSSALTVTTAGAAIQPGSALAVFDLAGEGMIRSLNIKMPSNATDSQLESLRLRVSYDNSSNFAIDVPIAHFFGAGFGRKLYKSLPMGTDSPDGFYCYLPMPFRRAAHVEIYNSSTDPIGIERAKIEYEICVVACDMGYCHAVYSRETTVSGQPFHTLLSVQGRGHYFGNLLYLEHAGDQRSMLEADDIVAVNPGSADETILYGTGLEDAYNGGYYYNHVLEQSNDGESADPLFGAGPFSGLLYIDFYDMPGFVKTRTDQYRWLIADCVPFTNGIEVKIENYGQVAGTTYGSTAFYYALPDIVDLESFAVFAEHWIDDVCVSPGWCDGYDNDENGKVGWTDLSLFAGAWLGCN